ncbi:AbrB/MazE/SpoVT family DNA-binding domain-containing protein [Venenivibrio stagnispumantis]|uniref:Transcriptional regulator, AbrB family n=1 Tax=Venenivibrio stagnispumantis TaxID=407998 RepID=A0AA46AF80_9AQUI|nr:AbrB/MazE/SpoVT family DNA-binding domain-containing protein [Venenivibrio stagnispumantis]MCW4573255.1 AbrB/MazE/SpoVT family DNA-binding domain-containing protein [Venenivibrio stagnispumantis]SMP18284.1 transcriptional regulator, AbrB family [Venenivibrio stagnispumantis]
MKKEELLVKVLPEGKVIIPKEIRDKLGIKEGSILIIRKRKNKIELQKVKTIKDFFGFLKGEKTATEEEIDKAIYEAVEEREKSNH